MFVMLHSVFLENNFQIIMKGDVQGFPYKLKKLILKNLQNEKLSVSWLAYRMNCSERQFLRLVRKYMGKTPNQLIAEIRLEYAHELLKRNVLNTKEVAFAVGYQKPSWFSNQFFLKYGIRPKEVVADLNVRKNAK